MKPSREEILEVVLVLFLLVSVSLVSAIFQHRMTVNQGLGWDGRFYYSMAEQIQQGKKPAGERPFIYRIGTPALAAVLGPNDPMKGFLIANVAAAALLTLLMIFWLRLYIDNVKTRLLLLALFITQWHGPVRFVYFYPNTTDPWMLVLGLAGLLCIAKLRDRWAPRMLVLICVLCFLAPLFREVGCLVGLAAVFSPNLLYSGGVRHIRKPALSSLLPLGCSFLGIVVSHLVVTTTSLYGYSFGHQAAGWMYHQSLARYLHAWLLAYGPIIFLVIFGWREVRSFFFEHQYQLVYLAGIIGLAWVGGNDTERFAFWAMPIIYVLCGKVMMKNSSLLRSWLMIVFLVFTQAISQRIFWTIPDEWGGVTPSRILLVPIGNLSYLNLFSYYGRKMEVSFIQYCLVGLVLLIWLHFRKRRASSRQSLPT